MPIYLETATIETQLRQRLLLQMPCFSFLSVEQIGVLADELQEISYRQGEVIVHQDDLIDSIYFIAKGIAEVSHKSIFRKKHRLVPIALLQEGENIGLNDTGFFSVTGKRTATVIALSEMLLLQLDFQWLHAFLHKNHLESRMYAAAEQILRLQLIKQSLPFSKLSPERQRWLCEKVEELDVSAGTIILHQGDIGDKCYLIRSGKIEIFAKELDGSSHSLAILKPPSLFGEATLITQLPRNATAHAVEDSQLLTLSYQYLSELWEQEQQVANTLMTLMVERSRPTRNPKISEFPRLTPEGATLVILKNPDNANYFKLSEEGWYLWQQMNGKHTLQEITLALADQYKVFSPHLVVALISKLASGGFLQNVNVGDNTIHQTMFTRCLNNIRQILEFRLIFKQADRWLTLAYNKLVRFVFTFIGQIVLATVAVVGLVVFFSIENRILEILRSLHASWLLFVCMIPLMMLTALFHELGHAFGTKAFGREVHSMGIGWYWIAPVAFTDMTDMWLDTRWHRIVANVAGVYANVFVAGICALLAASLSIPYLQGFLWLFAFTTYIKGFSMLNPAQDTDGYYILMDLFEQPHLRQKATLWLIAKFSFSAHRPHLFLTHWPAFVYWFTCILFLVLTALLTFYVQGFFLKLLGMQPPNIFSALFVPAITVVISCLSLIGDIRRGGE